MKILKIVVINVVVLILVVISIETISLIGRMILKKEPVPWMLQIVSNEDVKGIANIYVFWRIIYLIFCLPALFFFLFYKPKIYKFKKTRNF